MKQEDKQNMEKYGKDFKELTFKQKVNHIWEYYRWYILSFIIGAVIISSLVISIFTPQEVHDVDIVLAGKMNYDETQPEVVKSYKEMFNADLGLSIVDWDNMGEMGMAMLQKIPLLVKTDELDVLGLEPMMFESYTRQLGADMFVPLETIPEFSGLLEKYEDRLVTYNQKYNDDQELVEAEEHIYGIRISKFANIPCITANDEFIIGVTTTVKDLEKTAQLLDYLLDEGNE